jgi:trigger factor
MMDLDQIQITATADSACRRTVEICIPAALVADAVKSATRQFRSKAQIPGFRPGKVPEKLLRKRFGDDIRNEARQELIYAGVQAVITQGENDLAQMPEIDGDLAELEEGADYTFRVQYDVQPTFDVPEYKGLALERPPAEVTEEDVDGFLDHLRRGRSSFETVERAAAGGDLLSVSYKADAPDDLEIPDAGRLFVEAEENWLQIGDDESLPGVTEALTGATAGGSVEATLTFPEDFHQDFLAGQSLPYVFEVKEVQATVLPEVDDEFAKVYGSDSAEHLKDMVRERIQSERDGAVRSILEQQIFSVLLEGAEFDVPPSYLANETLNNFNRMVQQHQHAPHDHEHDESCSEEAMREQAAEMAQRSIRLRFIMREIAEAEDVTVEEDELNAAVEQTLAAAAARGEENVSDDQVRGMLEQNMLMDRTVAKLIDLADVTIKEAETDGGSDDAGSDGG